MTYEQFWYGELNLFNIYKEAYTRSIHYNSWTQGFYIHQAFAVNLHNALGGKNTKPKSYLEKPLYPKGDNIVDNKDIKSERSAFNAFARIGTKKTK